MTIPTPSTRVMTYGSSEHEIDAERLALYRRLASFHAGDIAERYRARAAEILARMNEHERRWGLAVTK